jgi:two-component system chemotaxis response regulator CheY
MSLNVLVVDDSSVMRAMIIRTLRMSGLPLGEIHEAANGAEALRLLDEHWIDLALVDINMPVMNGEELVEKVRQNPETQDLAVVVVSTEGSMTRIEKLKELGAGFVHKPFSPEILREAIVDITGVSDEQISGDETFQSSGPDF